MRCWAVVADANRYFAGEAPWALAKTDPVRQGTVLYVTAEVLRQVAILALPFMPASAAKLLDLLAIPEGERSFRVSRRLDTALPRARNFRRRRRFSRVTSSRRSKRRNEQIETDARRQPLPSRFSGFRRRTRRAWSARARAAGIERMVTISTRVKRLCRSARDHGAVSRRLLLGRHASA